MTYCTCYVIFYYQKIFHVFICAKLISVIIKIENDCELLISPPKLSVTIELAVVREIWRMSNGRTKSGTQ